MNTRTIYYINEEDILEQEVALARSRTLEQNLEAFCKTVIANYAMMGIDVVNYPVKRVIYYLEDE